VRGHVRFAGSGGDDVDVLLDALVGIVDRPRRELTAEVGVPGHPLVEHAPRQPDPPAQHETLGQVQVNQEAADRNRCQHGEYAH
jgi:hypothetical protein